MTFRVGVSFPQVFFESVDPESVRRVCRGAEDMGYDGLWVSDLPHAPSLEPLASLTFAAGVTSSIRLGIGVMLGGTRPAFQIARDVATLDQLSSGRVTLGFALGSRPAMYERYGLTSDRRLRRYLDALDAMQRWWAGEQVTADYVHLRLSGVSLGMTPVQRPRPPMWLGGRSEPAYRRAASMADGWMSAGSAPLALVHEELSSMRRHLDAEGRDPSRFALARRLFIAVTAVPNARQRLGDWFGRVYHKDLTDEVAVVGSPEEVVDRVLGLRDAGFTYVILNPVFDDVEQIASLRALVDAQTERATDQLQIS